MPALSLTAVDRQSVSDAALPLQLLRTQLLPSVASGTADHVNVATFIIGSGRLLKWVEKRCWDAGEPIAVSQMPGRLEDYGESFVFNRALVRRGVRMASYFDVSAMEEEIADFISHSADMPYNFAYGPVPIKIFDRRSVMLEGPLLDNNRRSVMVVSRPEFVAAAMRYVRRVREFAVPAREFAASGSGLSERQHAVARLLLQNHTDDGIAELLGLSVRTVRSEVAILMQELGVSTRFAAGAAYAQARALNHREAPADRQSPV